MNSLEQTIKYLAVSSWRQYEYEKTEASWASTADQFFGMYRLALWINDIPAADAAEFLGGLANQRAVMERESSYLSYLGAHSLRRQAG